MILLRLSFFGWTEGKGGAFAVAVIAVAFFCISFIPALSEGGDTAVRCAYNEEYDCYNEAKVDDEKYPDFMELSNKQFKRHHIILLVKEDTSLDESIPKEERKYGRKNLYELISHSNVKTYKTRPLIPKSLLASKRDGLILGSACEQGELYQAILREEPEEEIEKIASFL